MCRVHCRYQRDESQRPEAERRLRKVEEQPGNDIEMHLDLSYRPRNWTIGKSCIGDSRLESSKWTATCGTEVQSAISNLESPMQDFPIVQFSCSTLYVPFFKHSSIKRMLSSNRISLSGSTVRICLDRGKRTRRIQEFSRATARILSRETVDSRSPATIIVGIPRSIPMLRAALPPSLMTCAARFK